MAVDQSGTWFVESFDPALLTEIKRLAQQRAMEEPWSAPTSASGDSYFASVQTLTDEFVKQAQDFQMIPAPQAFDAAINHLRDSLIVLKLDHDHDPNNRAPFPGADRPTGAAKGTDPDLTKVLQVNTYLDDWTGAAATAFTEIFADGVFGKTVDAQFYVVAALESALLAEKEIWKRARSDAKTIVDNMVTSLENVHQMGPHEWALVLTIVSLILSVDSYLKGPLGVAVLYVQILSAVSAGASTYLNGQPEGSVPMGGNTTAEILAHGIDALLAIRRLIADREETAASALSQTHDLIEQYPRSFALDWPKLLPDPNDPRSYVGED